MWRRNAEKKSDRRKISYHSRRSREERGVLIVVIIDALLPDAAPDQIITLASRVVLTVVSASNHRIGRTLAENALIHHLKLLPWRE